MSTNPAPIQFDNAEFGQGPSASGGVSCAACKRPIVDQYFEAASQVFCESCAAVLKAGPQGGSRVWRTVEALLLGTMGGVIGAVIWFLIWKFTGYEFGLIAIVVGLMVGGGVRKGSRARGGWFYQLMAIAITYASITATNIPPFIEALNQGAINDHDETVTNAKKITKITLHSDGAFRIDDRECAAANVESELTRLKNEGTTLLVYREGRMEGVDATDEVNALHHRMSELEIPMAYFNDSTFQTPLYLDFKEIRRDPVHLIITLVLGFVIALVVPFLTLPQNIIGLIIIAIALYEAWKINKKPVLAVNGPFMLSPGEAFGQGSIVHVPPPVMPSNPPPAFDEPPQGTTPS